MKPNSKPHQKLAWAGTVTLLMGSVLAAFNFYPMYVFLFCIANGIWVAVGILWKERSLIVLNAGLTVIYILGLFFGS
jgi:hypothetical protein